MDLEKNHPDSLRRLEFQKFLFQKHHQEEISCNVLTQFDREIHRHLAFTPIYEKLAEKNQESLINSVMTHYFCHRGFYALLLEFKQYRDLSFRSGPYFFSNKGMYLNRWTPEFDPEYDIPLVVLVWVILPHLPLHCQRDDALK